MAAGTLGLSALTLLGWLLLCAPGLAQNDSPAASTAAKRAQAVDLSSRGRQVEALPLLEELTATLPNDPLVWERYAVALLSASATERNEEAARQMRLRAKDAFKRTRALGNNSALASLGDSIADDGRVAPLSRNPEAKSAMDAGEAAFAKGDFTDAIALYQKALTIEPTNYNATLFIGDCYYRLRDLERAGEWFSRAIALNANIETAHRYWGDALLAAKKPDEAKAHFIDAFLAEPYNQNARTGLSQWGQATGARFGRPVITPPATVEKTATGNAITVDPSSLAAPSDGTSGKAAWLMYSLARAQWQNDEFAKRFPNEPAYRHSLAEEVFAFARLIAFADEQESKGQPVSDPQVATIRDLRDRGMLEAYVLLHAADAGIARDYPQYRAEHRDRLQAYVESMIVLPQR
jgi:tetratricopeptide (TPR) repeat protein